MNINDFENINLYCFDLAQYDSYATILEVLVFANCQGITYYAENIKVDPLGAATWNGYKWEFINEGANDVLKIKALIDIYKHMATGKITFKI